MNLTGTLINYYFHCKRQCWLFANRINLEHNSEDVRIGKILHEIENEGKKNTEVSVDSIKVDKITDDYLVELKKSDADVDAAKWQILYYLKVLREKGIERKGKVEFIEKNKQDKKTIYIELTEEYEKQLEELKNRVSALISRDMPEPPALEVKCKKCAYYEYCFI